MVYLPTPRPVTVDVSKLTGNRVNAWWFNQRHGKATAAEMPAAHDSHGLRPPSAGADDDWLLVLNDEAKAFVPAICARR